MTFTKGFWAWNLLCVSKGTSRRQKSEKSLEWKASCNRLVLNFSCAFECKEKGESRRRIRRWSDFKVMDFATKDRKDFTLSIASRVDVFMLRIKGEKSPREFVNHKSNRWHIIKQSNKWTSTNCITRSNRRNLLFSRLSIGLRNSRCSSISINYRLHRNPKKPILEYPKNVYWDDATLSSTALSIQSNNELLWKYERVVDGEARKHKLTWLNCWETNLILVQPFFPPTSRGMLISTSWRPKMIFDILWVSNFIARTLGFVIFREFSFYFA